MVYVAERNNETYVTENRKIATKLSEFFPENFRGTSVVDVLGYFKIQVGVDCPLHPQHKSTFQVLAPSALRIYLNDAEEKSKLPEFDEKREALRIQREANQRALDSLVKK